MPRTQQPDWRFVTNLGDADPITYGGKFLYVDATGVYPPEVEILEPPSDGRGFDFPFNGYKADSDNDEEDPVLEKKPEDIRPVFKWEVRRIQIEPCTWIDGILSDNKFHPKHPAWFAQPYNPARPQDGPGGLESLSESLGITVEELVKQFLSEDVRERALAWIQVGEHHGWINLDEYPNYFTMAEVEERYKEELAIESRRTREGDFKVFQKVWTHHPRGGFITGYASDPFDTELFGLTRSIAISVEAAACRSGHDAPDSQITVGEPPAQV